MDRNARSSFVLAIWTQILSLWSFKVSLRNRLFGAAPIKQKLSDSNLANKSTEAFGDL